MESVESLKKTFSSSTVIAVAVTGSLLAGGLGFLGGYATSQAGTEEHAAEGEDVPASVREWESMPYGRKISFLEDALRAYVDRDGQFNFFTSAYDDVTETYGVNIRKNEPYHTCFLEAFRAVAYGLDGKAAAFEKEPVISLNVPCSLMKQQPG